MNLSQTILWHVKNHLDSVVSALSLSSTLAVTGAATLTGGIAQATAISGAHNLQITGATNGTDTAFADGTQFVTSIFLPVNFVCTNIEYLVGSVGGTDKVYGVIYDADGAVLANTSLTAGGATVGTAAQIQQLALTATEALVGPALYYVGISANGATAKIRTAPAYLGASLWGGSVSQAHGTVAAITEPVTFTADKAPYVILS